MASLLYSFSSVQAASFPEPGNFANGSRVWADNCSRCHNIRSPEELRDDQWITTAFHMRVRAGLTGQETRDVITFLQGSNTKAAPVDSKPRRNQESTSFSGEEIYSQTCIACHGANGAGALPGVPDFTRTDGPLGKSDDVLLANVTNGFQSPGSSMAMPPKGGNPDLNLLDIKKVIAYIREVFGK